MYVRVIFHFIYLFLLTRLNYYLFVYDKFNDICFFFWLVYSLIFTQYYGTVEVLW